MYLLIKTSGYLHCVWYCITGDTEHFPSHNSSTKHAELVKITVKHLRKLCEELTIKSSWCDLNSRLHPVVPGHLMQSMTLNLWKGADPNGQVSLASLTIYRVYYKIEFICFHEPNPNFSIVNRNLTTDSKTKTYHITQKKKKQKKKAKQNKTNQMHDGLFCLHRVWSGFTFNAHTSTLTPKAVCFVLVVECHIY